MIISEEIKNLKENQNQHPQQQKKPIEKLQEIQKEHGDVEVLAMENTWGEGDWASLEDSGVSFDRYNEGENVLYIGW